MTAHGIWIAKLQLMFNQPKRSQVTPLMSYAYLDFHCGQRCLAFDKRSKRKTE